MIRNTADAIFLLQDTEVFETERATAISYLQNHPTPQAVEALVAALEDDDYTVREHAGTALATLGEAAFPTLLQALAQERASVRLRSAARHVIVNNKSGLVRAESEELLEALEAPDGDEATMEAAGRLLESLG